VKINLVLLSDWQHFMSFSLRRERGFGSKKHTPFLLLTRAQAKLKIQHFTTLSFLPAARACE